ncbi:MAG: hypothetical protein ACLS36_05340 [Streptococcus sp.]
MAKEAIERARRGDGPTLIEAVLIVTMAISKEMSKNTSTRWN